MDTQHIQQEIRAREIVFPNGNRARLVAPPAGAKAADIIRALDIRQPQALVLVIGGASGFDEPEKSRLTQMFSRGVARAVVDVGGLIIDGGTEAGVMSMIGQGVADRGRKTPLLGVVPAGKVTYPGGPAEGSIEDGAPLDPNHSHFVLVESDEWGGETATMYALAEALANRGLGPPVPVDGSTDGRAAAQPASATIPVVTVLAGGNTEGIARDEVLWSVRRGWPIIVIEGSGCLADEIARQIKQKPSFIAEPALAEIIDDGDIQLFPLDGAVTHLEQLIRGRLKGDSSLKLVWERFALYDSNADRQQTNFRWLRRLILTLGVLGTLLAVSQTALRNEGLLAGSPWLDQGLHYMIVIVPILTSILLAASSRFTPGSRYILLRANAEAIKREIFRYRARAGIYSDQQTQKISREAKLAREVETISRQLMQTNVNRSSLRPYKGPIPPKMHAAAADDGLSFLTPDRYLTIRLGAQLNFYRSRTNKLERRMKTLQWLIYIGGGVGTFLAAIGFELWVALTTAFVTAFTASMEYQQIENTLIKYNQAATDLASVQGWWVALSANQQTDQENINKLVDYTERILQTEHTGWVQRMQDALAKLRDKEERQDEDGEEDQDNSIPG